MYTVQFKCPALSPELRRKGKQTPVTAADSMEPETEIKWKTSVHYALYSSNSRNDGGRHDKPNVLEDVKERQKKREKLRE